MAKAEATPTGTGPQRLPKRSRRRLRTRIVLSFLLLGMGLTLALTLATNWARNSVEDQLVQDAMNRNIDEFAQRFYTNPAVPPEVPFEQVRGFMFTRDDFDRARERFPDWVDLPNGNHRVTGIDDDGSKYAYRLAVRKADDAWFFLAYDMSQSLQGEQRYTERMLVLVLLFVLASFLMGWWAASRVMSPVTDLARRLRSSGNERHHERLAPHFADDEVGELAKALDDYADRLTEVVDRDREFNADVSHELRTPLAVIKGAVELLLTRPGIDDKTVARLLRIQRAEQQGTDLISALLLLSRSERGQGDTDVARLAEQLLDAHRTQIGAKPLELRLEGERGLRVAAPEAAVSVALGNLIGNAVKYTQSGAVVVRLRADSVDVIDSGPGLSAEDAAKLFERGYRGSHAEHTQGGGIGLSIVRRLCDLYGWQVRVVPGIERGVIATLRFS